GPGEEGIGVQVGVIEARDHHLADEPLELGEIHHHAGALVHRAAQCYLEGVVVTVGDGERPERARVLLGAPRRLPVPVGRGERELAGDVDGAGGHGTSFVNLTVSRKRCATLSGVKAGARRGPASPGARAGSGLPSSAARASARAGGSRGGTSTPVWPSSTTSGTAALRHATTGRPAAIASRKTIPKPSCTDGRQKHWALM